MPIGGPTQVISETAASGAPEPPRTAAWEIRSLALLLLVFSILLVSIAWRTGVTIDEPLHLLSAHLYWKGADNLFPGDMPPAIKIVGGWVSHFFPVPVPYDNKQLWDSRIEWEIAREMMARLRAPLLQQIFFYSRLPMIVFPLLTCITLWWWARRLFSPRVGILIAILFCLSPTVLAHGALFKNDMAASFGYLIFWCRAWVYWRDPSRRNAVWLGAGLLVAILAKLSLLILLPVAPMILLGCYFATPARSLRGLAIHVVLLVAVTYAGIAAAWQFRIGVVSTVDLQNWRANPRIARWIPIAANLLRIVPTPPRLRQGVISLVESNASDNGIYLLGRVYPGGHPLYFLVAMATKIPLPTQLLLGAALFLLSLDLARRHFRYTDWFWLVPPVLYLLLASVSSLQLGLRLVLPALAFFALWSGRAIEFLLKRRETAAVLGLLALWLGARTAFQYPHYIAYFNALAGGSDKGIQYLSDSNLDWGQDLPALADYLRRNKTLRVKLAYFGNDNPYGYIPEQRLTPIAAPWNASLATVSRLKPEPGYYAISATLLTGQFFDPRFRDYYQAFREKVPIAKAGYSIFIYRVQEGTRRARY